MAQPLPPMPTLIETPQASYLPRSESPSSGVSWAAISSGSFVTAALFLALLALGAGAGLSSISPWSNTGASPSTVHFGAILWLIFIEIVACALGGYIAGRLRTKWTDVHTDEVFFRDTAHGFLVWAVSLVVTAAFLTAAATSMVGGDRSVPTPRSDSAVVDANRYFIDSLFRSNQTNGTAEESQRTEIGLIFAHSLSQKELSSQDKTYIADVVAARTGISHSDAETRVADAFERDRQAVDTARRTAAHGLYWLFVALLLGAFAASAAATLGGKQRDRSHLARA